MLVGLTSEIHVTNEFLSHIRDAVVSLETLLGVTDHEDVLDTLFQSFCVGK